MARRRGKRWTASGYDKALGRKRHLGTFDTRREAEQVEARWKLRTARRGEETCDSFAERWTRDYPRPRESTNKHNAERIKLFARDFAGVRLADVDRPSARAWAVRHRGHLGAVRAMFNDAVSDGLCDVNPFAKLRLPSSRGRRDIVALTEAQLHELADKAPGVLPGYGVEYRALVLFAGYTGVRPGELFALRRDDIIGEHLRIERALAPSTRKIGPTKNGRPRTVVIPPPASAALAEVPPHAGGLLFTGPRGGMLTQSSHHRVWSLVRVAAGRPELDFYELRHCAATMLLERGVTPWDVAVQLGHTDGGQLVQEVYGHPSEAGARARLLGAWDPPAPAGSGAEREQVS